MLQTTFGSQVTFDDQWETEWEYYVPEIDGTYTCHWGHPFLRINLMDFIYFVFACMPSDAYHRQFKSPLLCPLGYACEVKQAFVNLLCWIYDWVLERVPVTDLCKLPSVNPAVVILLCSKSLLSHHENSRETHHCEFDQIFFPTPHLHHPTLCPHWSSTLLSVLFLKKC